MTSVPFAHAFAHGGEWSQLAKQCADQLEGQAEGGTLAFLYVTPPLESDLSSLLAFLRQKTRVPHWIGGVGSGVLGLRAETHGTAAVSVLVTDFPQDSFGFFPALSEPETRLDAEATDWLGADRPAIGLVHGDPRLPHTPALITALSEQAEAYLIGGLIAGQADQAQIADDVIGAGLSGVLFKAGAPLVCGLSQGYSPIGPAREVTACEANILIELDGQPALDALKEDVGEILARDLRRASGFIHAAFLNPGSDQADYAVRHLIGVDPEDGRVALGDYLTEGRRVMFVKRDPDAAAQDLRRMAKETLKRAGGSARGGLYVACVARGPNMFGAEGAEVEILAEELGEVPLTGFYAQGEICNGRLYGYTGVLTLFR